MGTTYTKPTSEMTEMIEAVMEKFHGELAEHEVTVGCQVAWNAKTGLLLRGEPCVAIVEITPYKRRFQGVADAMITIDHFRWKDLSDEEKLAAIDHELHHLVIARDKHGNARSDDLGRPKLKMRLHDLVVGGFQAIIRRHGRHALELKAITRINELLRQQEFDWTDDMAEADGPPEGLAEELAGAASSALAAKAKGRKGKGADEDPA